MIVREWHINGKTIVDRRPQQALATINDAINPRDVEKKTLDKSEKWQVEIRDKCTNQDYRFNKALRVC